MDEKAISNLIKEGIKTYFDEKEERERIKAEAKAKAERRKRLYMDAAWGVLIIGIFYLIWKTLHLF